jgi:hypothetical protein
MDDASVRLSKVIDALASSIGEMRADSDSLMFV